MKRTIIIAAALFILLVSCNVEVGKESSSNVTPPDGCHAYLTYGEKQTGGTTNDVYNWLRVGIQDSASIGWEMYDYDVYVSLDGEAWNIVDGTQIVVPKNTGTFYLKAVTYSICRYEGHTFLRTSISTYMNDVKQSNTCYVQVY